jgi:hypothetical protein
LMVSLLLPLLCTRSGSCFFFCFWGGVLHTRIVLVFYGD